MLQTLSASSRDEHVSAFPSGWRTDIEGLRGIAVLLVVLYHAKIPFFAGGYVGVDVFFVLSGYLITGILVNEAERTGTINLPRFYARRARRLLPASFMILIFVSFFAYIFYAPIEQENFAKTAIATAAYLSNFFFARRATDYLAAEAETNPLLHTWSLAVEEQFYVVWPALVLFLFVGVAGTRRRIGQKEIIDNRQRLVWGTTLLAVASFVLTLYLMDSGQTHWAFFSSPARAWEFALGGLGVLVPRLRFEHIGRLVKSPSDEAGVYLPALSTVMGWMGLFAVVFTGMFYTAKTPFPGWAALLPALGTVFILRAGDEKTSKTLTQVLSWGPLSQLGRLSYSLYLWHWPVLVFASGLFEDLNSIDRLLLVLLSAVLAEFSYRYVENPIRRNRVLGRRSAFGIALLGGLTACSLSLGVGWMLVTSMQMRTPDQARLNAVRSDIPDVYARDCHLDFKEVTPAACSDGPNDSSFTVVVYGDSHAAQWIPALQKIALQKNWRLVYLTKSACPGVDVSRFADNLGRVYAECDEWRQLALGKIQLLLPDLVVMSSSSNYSFSLAEWAKGSESVFRSLSESAGSVIVIRDTPLPNNDVVICLSRETWQQRLQPLRNFGASCDFAVNNATQVSVHDSQLAAASKFSNVYVLDLTEMICPDGTCNVEDGDTVLFRDSHHLSASFVHSLSGELGKAIDEVLHNLAVR